MKGVIIVVAILLGFFLLSLTGEILKHLIRSYYAIQEFKKRGNKYISIETFIQLICIFPFNKRKRFNKYLNVLDPASKLVVNSMGFDSDEYETYLNNKIETYLNEFMFGKELKKKYTRDEMYEYIQSEEYDSFGGWLNGPHILNHILELPYYNEDKKLNTENLSRTKTLLESPHIKKIIFSNKASKEFLSAKLVDLEKSVFDFDDKDFEDNEVEIALLKLALGHVTLSEQKNINELLSQYN